VIPGEVGAKCGCERGGEKEGKKMARVFSN